MKKKYITTLLFTFLLICCAMLFADDKTTNVKYTVDSNYSWEIHTDINFGADKGTYMYLNETAVLSDNTQAGVRVNSNVIPPDTMLNISLANSNTFRLVNGNTTLDYSVSTPEHDLSAGESVLKVPSGTNTASQSLEFTLRTQRGSAEIAGTYTGEVNYVAEIVPMIMHTVTLDMGGKEDNIVLTCLDGESITLPDDITSPMQYMLIGSYGGVDEIEYGELVNPIDNDVYVYDESSPTLDLYTDLPDFYFDICKGSNYDVVGYGTYEDYSDYYPGDTYQPDGDITLYAVWEENDSSIDIKFAEHDTYPHYIIDEATWDTLSDSYAAPSIEQPICINQETSSGTKCVLVSDYAYRIYGPGDYLFDSDYPYRIDGPDDYFDTSSIDFYDAFHNYDYYQIIREGQSDNWPGKITLVISSLSPVD